MKIRSLNIEISKKLKIIDKKYFYMLFSIFIIALIIRFINFSDSIYFGYDEARDAYDAQNIYLKGDLKISGPPASAFKGINHGPVYLYILGPLFLLGGGSPELASAVFRIINALGIFLVAYLVDYYFGKPRGLIAALLYAFSFEQHQYAIFTGNPALSNSFWPVLFIGAGLLYKSKKYKEFGIFLMFLAASFISQFDLILSYSFLVVIILLVLMRDKLKSINWASWLKILFFGLAPVYTYPLAEFINKFLGIKTFVEIFTKSEPLANTTESAFTIVLNNFGKLFVDNVTILAGTNLSIFFAIGILSFLLVKARSNILYLFIALWTSSLFFLIATRGFMPFYSYAGVGIGIIIAASLVFYEIFKNNKAIFFLLITICIVSSLQRINLQSKRALIVDIKAQPGMLLSEQKDIIQKSYSFAGYQAFTVRTITMPYKVQTVWSYLFNQYGQNEYGYMPYLEGGNTLGYPGEFPEPIKGVTCKRILIKEPVRGIPEVLINMEVGEENLFSTIEREEKIGDFVIQYRLSKENDCHHVKPKISSRQQTNSLLPNL